jgi:hypothetical protein
MASLMREKEARKLVHESYSVDTADHEDHTFCGVMFDLVIKDALPINYVQVDSLWVRGAMGPMTAWVVQGGFDGKHEDKAAWTQIYAKEHGVSMQEFVELKLDYPLQLQPGGRYGLYVHSARPGDESVVYDNQRGHVSHEDNFIGILPGMAHLSNRPFSKRGMWWAAWRQNREFVGRVSYAVRYLLWNPECHLAFPENFRNASATLHNQHALSWAGLPSEIVLYILNMCPHDWFDTEADKEAKKSGGKGKMSRLVRKMAERAAGAMRRVSGRFRGGGEDEDGEDEDSDSDYSEGGGAGMAQGSDDEEASEESEGQAEHHSHYGHRAQGFQPHIMGEDDDDDDDDDEYQQGGEDSDEDGEAIELPLHVYQAIMAAMVAQQHQGGGSDEDGAEDGEQMMADEAEEVVEDGEQADADA